MLHYRISATIVSPWIHKCLLEIMHPVFIHRVGLGNTTENRAHVLMIVTFITIITIITIRAPLYKLSLFTYTVCEHMTARYPLVQHPLYNRGSNRGSTRTTLDTIVAPLLYTPLPLYIHTALQTYRSTNIPLYKKTSTSHDII